MLKFDNIFEFKQDGQYQFDDVSGVYAIVNLLNNKKYIGSSSSIRRRYRQHFNELCNNKHSNTILQRAFNKYGQKHFGFLILETCEDVKDTLLFIEQKYIDELGDYNICKVAGKTTGIHNSGHAISEAHKQIIANSNKNRQWSESSLQKKSEWMKTSALVASQRKKIDVYSLDNTYMCTYDSIADAAKHMGNINKRVSIKRCCQGKYKSAYGFKWKYHKDNNYDK